MSGQKKSQLDQGVQDLKRQRKGAFRGINTKLAAAMEQKEYMELSTQEVCVFSSTFQVDISIVQYLEVLVLLVLDIFLQIKKFVANFVVFLYIKKMKWKSESSDQ